MNHPKCRDLYSSPKIMWMINSMTIRWAGQVAHIRENRNAYMVFIGKPEGNNQLEDLGID
jgi:hypothetical protein